MHAITHYEPWPGAYLTLPSTQGVMTSRIFEAGGQALGERAMSDQTTNRTINHTTNHKAKISTEEVNASLRNEIKKDSVDCNLHATWQYSREHQGAGAWNVGNVGYWRLSAVQRKVTSVLHGLLA